MTAPELSDRERRIVAEFDAAPTPPEVLREQVARELWAADAEVDVDLLSGETPQRFYRLADAALAAFGGQQDPAVQRVLALADELDGEAKEHAAAEPASMGDLRAMTAAMRVSQSAAFRIRATIGGAQ